MKLNSVEDYEHLCNVTLTKEKYPKAFEEKIQEMLEEKACDTREEAEKLVANMEIQLEIYYHKHFGLFAVDSEAVEAGTIFSPYDGSLCEDADIIEI